MFAWFVQAQSSLDDVHVEPRQKPNAELSSGDAAGARGLSSHEAHTKPLRVDVDLVLVPVTVTDALNHPVTALQKQDFQLYEGEKQQEIRYFFQEEEPLSVAVLLDVSKSMSDKIATEREALQDFFNNANPEDEYFEITFSDRPRLVASSTILDRRVATAFDIGRTGWPHRHAGCDLFGRGPIADRKVQAPGDCYLFRRRMTT